MTNSTTTIKVYQASNEGFTRKFTSLDDLRVWANGLNARWNLTGKELNIYKGTQQNGIDVFPSCKPSLVIVF
jgi:hypothetical protein